MRYLLSILFSISTLLAFGQQNDSLYQNLLKNSDWEGALTYSEEQIKSLKSDSLKWEWQLEMLSTLQQAKRFKEAEQLYLTLEKLSSGLQKADLLEQAVQLYATLGQTELMIELDAERLQSLEQELGKENPQYIRALMTHGSRQMSRQRYRKAEFLYETALKLWESIGEKSSMNYAETQNYLAGAYSALHKDKEAVELYQSILLILEKEMGKSSQPYKVVTSNLSQSYLKLDQLDQSLELAKAALKSCQQADPSGKACDNYTLSIAFTLMNMEEYDAALEALKEVLAIRQEKFGEKHPQLSIAYINLADGHRRKGNYAEGEKAILNAIYANTPALNKIPTMEEMKKMIFKEYFLNPYLIATALSMLDKVYDSQYQNTEELDVLKTRFKTLNLFGRYIEQVANEFRADEDKLWLVSVSNKEYAKAIEVAQLLHQKTKNEDYLKRSFFFFESNKAALLAASLKGNEALQFGNIPNDLLEKEKDLRQTLDQLKKQLQEAQIQKNKMQETNARTALTEQKLKIKTHQKALEKEYPNYYSYKYETAVPDIEIFQEDVLKEGQAILEYYWWKGRAFVLTLTKDQIQLHQIELESKDLRTAIEEFRTTLTSYKKLKANPEESKAAYLEQAHQLYQQLLAPALESLEGIQSLIIIPDDVIGQLPFEALLTEGVEADQAFANMPFVLKKYELSYSYSAALLLENLRPQTGKASKGLLAFAASYQGSTENAQTRSLRHSKLRKILQDLPAVKAEVENISRLLPGEAFYGEAANEAAFSKNAADYSVLHLAMHALLNEEFPLLSSLAFTENGDSSYDNFLEAHEISNMQLNADLVVLSACETGYGKFESGEGVMSLARSFMYAGVPSLVVSLWQVNDASTAIIMENFYEQLARGQSKAAALQQAKLQYIKLAAKDNPIAAHPAFWAAFIQLGNPGPLQISTATSWWSWIWVIGIPIIVIIGFWLVLRRKNKEV